VPGDTAVKHLRRSAGGWTLSTLVRSRKYRSQYFFSFIKNALKIEEKVLPQYRCINASIVPFSWQLNSAALWLKAQAYLKTSDLDEIQASTF
jgi:hypothetical protein